MVKNTLFTSRNEAYEKFLYSEDLLLIRKMLVLSLVLYSGFGLVDRWIEVENLAIFSMIRFYIVAPSTLVTLDRKSVV